MSKVDESLSNRRVSYVSFKGTAFISMMEVKSTVLGLSTERPLFQSCISKLIIQRHNMT